MVRTPVPITINKAGANYKSEVKHLEYSPRTAFQEWLNICEGICEFGGDAIFKLEDLDKPFLDHKEVFITEKGDIQNQDDELIGHVSQIHTGRVFTANGPWVIVEGNKLKALMPNMINHRRVELDYFRDVLVAVSRDAKLKIEIMLNPFKWEGMADVATLGDKVIFTYTVEGHYDEIVETKSMRSSIEGCRTAAEFASLKNRSTLFSELVYPHFHGDTVQFSLRGYGEIKLMHYPKGLWRDESTQVLRFLGKDRVAEISRNDAVEAYAGNCRQINSGLLMPDQVSEEFCETIENMSVAYKKVSLKELFGKSGGGPGCATLYLPKNLKISPNSDLRYSVRRNFLKNFLNRYPEKVTVDPKFFEGKKRG